MGTTLQAAKGKFKLVGVDTFDNTNWTVGEYDKLEDAAKEADKQGGDMLKMHVYDDEGKHRHDAGTF